MTVNDWPRNHSSATINRSSVYFRSGCIARSALENARARNNARPSPDCNIWILLCHMMMEESPRAHRGCGERGGEFMFDGKSAFLTSE
jgi:hypothetical protein